MFGGTVIILLKMRATAHSGVLATPIYRPGVFRSPIAASAFVRPEASRWIMS
jgi:hypothetical protein